MKKYVLCSTDKCLRSLVKLILFLLIAVGSAYTLVALGIVFGKWMLGEDFTIDLLVLPVFTAVAVACAGIWRWGFGPIKIKTKC